MSEKQPNEPISFSRFADWCRHIESLSEEARHTVKVLLKKAGTEDAQAAEQILSSMTELDLSSNQISDISFLGLLVNLTTLNLIANQITDISSLGSLTNLTKLHLSYNQIRDFSFLGSLTNLKILSLHNNSITDFSFLDKLPNLTALYLSKNGISDFRFLGFLTNLTTLYLGENQITDISFLHPLTNLTTLYVHNNPISDFSFLASLTNLTTLDLNNNRITDITSLGSLTHLTELIITENQITDISFLASLTNLTTLNLYGNQITDISPLQTLTNLTTLNLRKNQITDISPLQTVTNLTTLMLDWNKISDIRSIASLTHLKELILDGAGVSWLLGCTQTIDISPLQSLTNLTTLVVESNRITDISPLRSLTNLTTLRLSGNPINDIWVSGELAQKHLTLSTEPINIEKATAAVKLAYAVISLEAPEVIICRSPRELFLLISDLLKRDDPQNCSEEWPSNRWGKKLGWKWMSPSIVREFASPAVWENEFDHLSIIDSEADTQMISLMYELAREYAESERRMGNVFPDHWFWEFYGTPTTLLKEIYLTELYVSSSGINLSQKVQEILRCQKLLFEHCGFIVRFEKICVLCDRPRHLRFDSQNRLHAEAIPAIEFADGYNLYYHHGVKLPEKYSQLHPDRWQSEWLLSETNPELRRVLIQAMSFSSFADWCKHINSLSQEARNTVQVLLKKAGTDDREAAERILSSMTELNLSYTGIKDIRSLGSFTNLTTLSLNQNQITDISSLGSLTNLTTLHLDHNQITDISSLGSLTNLTTLHLNGNQIIDISALRSLTNLTTLHLYWNPIIDIRALRSLTHLTTLHLWPNQITDISFQRLTLSTRPIDAEKATEAIKVAYATIGLEEPEIIICSSPRDAYLQIFNLPKRDRSQNCSDEWDSNRLGEKLDWKWMSPSIVREFANPLVWKYELDSMTIESEADSTLSSLMYELADSYVRSERMMGNVFPDHLFDLTSPETPTTLFKEIYLTEWYISSLGVNVSQKAKEILRSQKLLFEHCGWIFPFEKFCAVCDRPRHLRFDSQNRLHAEAEPAIEFADGWNFYYYHGVRLPEEYGKVHPNQWQSQGLLAEENAELRRVLIQGIGYDRICQELSAEQIDSWQEYSLLKIDNADIEPIYLLKMTCPSTGFIHALRVPPNLTSAREAIRWANWDIDPEEFSVQT